MPTATPDIDPMSTIGKPSVSFGSGPPQYILIINIILYGAIWYYTISSIVKYLEQGATRARIGVAIEYIVLVCMVSMLVSLVETGLLFMNR